MFQHISFCSVQRSLQAGYPNNWNCHVLKAPAGSSSNGLVYYVRLNDSNGSYIWVAQCKPAAGPINAAQLGTLADSAYKS